MNKDHYLVKPDADYIEIMVTDNHGYNYLSVKITYEQAEALGIELIRTAAFGPPHYPK